MSESGVERDRVSERESGVGRSGSWRRGSCRQLEVCSGLKGVTGVTGVNVGVCSGLKRVNARALAGMHSLHTACKPLYPRTLHTVRPPYSMLLQPLGSNGSTGGKVREKSHGTIRESEGGTGTLTA